MVSAGTRGRAAWERNAYVKERGRLYGFSENPKLPRLAFLLARSLFRGNLTRPKER